MCLLLTFSKERLGKSKKIKPKQWPPVRMSSIHPPNAEREASDECWTYIVARLTMGAGVIQGPSKQAEHLSQEEEVR